MSELFEPYLSQRSIIESLIAIRVSEAQKRHNTYYYKNLNYRAKYPSITDSEVINVMPPRSRWVRPNLLTRKSMISSDVYKLSIRKAINRQFCVRKSKREAWFGNLEFFISNVRKSVLQDIDHIVETPKILPIAKGKDSDRYRPLAKYSLKDRVIIGSVAKYLRTIFDPLFLDNSYAFRAKSGSNLMPTHHTAVENLINYSSKFGGNDIWVAECDIKKFFDTIHHDVAINSLNEAMNRLNHQAIYIDSRAIKLFYSFLKSYTFANVAIPEFDRWKKEKGISGRLSWPRHELGDIYYNVNKEEIGIPQGGALSPLIANLVLDAADKKVIQKGKDNDLFYARYCDDMVILHRDEKQCKLAFQRYQSVIQEKNLIIHEPEIIKVYDKSYYKLKSKHPYIWGKRNGRLNVVPWLSFLGYQIRHDNLIRVRKSSVLKERDKQKDIADKILEIIKGKIPTTNKSSAHIKTSFESKLVYMSVGTNKLNRRFGSFCWTSGFALLNKYKSNTSQLQYLDRMRNNQVFRIRLSFKKHILPFKPNKGRKHRSLRYYGYPFSYTSQLK